MVGSEYSSLRAAPVWLPSFPATDRARAIHSQNMLELRENLGAFLGHENCMLQPQPEPALEVNPRLERNHHSGLQDEWIVRHDARFLVPGDSQPMATVMRIPAAQSQDALAKVGVEVTGAHPGVNLVNPFSECGGDSSKEFPLLRGRLADDAGVASVSPISLVPGHQVRNNQVALLN